MIPAQFDYAAPESLGDALTLLAGKPDSKILAGGQSLIPILKLRLAEPAQLIDLGSILELHFIAETGGVIRIGAMTTHNQVETSELLREKCPLLAETAANIGDVQVRNRGTIGGSVVHADPAADYPAALLALEAKVRLVSRPPLPKSWETAGTVAGTALGQIVKGAKALWEEIEAKEPDPKRRQELKDWRVLPNKERVLRYADFLGDPDEMGTALGPSEILTEIHVPIEDDGAGVVYKTMVQPASGYAIVGVAVRLSVKGGKIASARVALTGVAAKPYRAAAVESALLGQAPSAELFSQAAQRAAEGVEALSDLHASAEYRAHLAGVQARRALEEAAARAK
ncbi:MAG: xanthine dehydrogenase family protein subunit M [Bryobacterales bacterium]